MPNQKSEKRWDTPARQGPTGLDSAHAETDPRTDTDRYGSFGTSWVCNVLWGCPLLVGGVRGDAAESAAESCRLQRASCCPGNRPWSGLLAKSGCDSQKEGPGAEVEVGRFAVVVVAAAAVAVAAAHGLGCSDPGRYDQRMSSSLA